MVSFFLVLTSISGVIERDHLGEREDEMRVEIKQVAQPVYRVVVVRPSFCSPSISSCLIDDTNQERRENQEDAEAKEVRCT